MPDNTDSSSVDIAGTKLRENVPVTATATVYERNGPLTMVAYLGRAEGDDGDTYVIDVSGTVLRVTGTLTGAEDPVVVDLDLHTLIQHLVNLAGWGLHLDMGSEVDMHMSAARMHLGAVQGSRTAQDAAAMLDRELRSD